MVLRRTDLDILTDLHVFGPPECGKVVFEMLYACLYVRLASGFYSNSVFKNLFIIGCYPVSFEISK
jgi:hypothetical protein